VERAVSGPVGVGDGAVVGAFAAAFLVGVVAGVGGVGPAGEDQGVAGGARGGVDEDVAGA
jgi:hypothetical protein